MSLTLLALGARAWKPPMSGGGLTITDFSRDIIVYDSGAHIGNDFATVPVGGNGTAGQVIQAQAYSVDDEGKTSTIWVDVATVSAGGTWAGTLSVLRNSSQYTLRAREKLNPGTVVETTKKFVVGHKWAIWGQSEDERKSDPAFMHTTPPPLLTIKQQLYNLAKPGVTGRNSKATLKVAGVDALPPGASLNNTTRVITLTGTGTLKDWSFTDYEIQPDNGSDWKISQCEHIETGTRALSYFIRALRGGKARVRRCTFTGASRFTGMAAALKEDSNVGGTGYGYIDAAHCRVTGLPSDAFNICAGIIRWSYAYWERNLDQIPISYNTTTTYAVGDHVYNGSGWVFSSKVAGNVNNPLPSSKASSNTWWAARDPHVDCVTVTDAHVKTRVEYCFFDISQLKLANGGTGGNNNVRMESVSNLGPWNGSMFRYCLFERDSSEASVPIQMSAGNFGGPAYFESCWMRPRTSGTSYIYTVNAGQEIYWTNMKHIDTDAAITAPTNCVVGTATAADNTQKVQMIKHDRNVVGSGSAGVVHTRVSDATPLTAAYVAMANAFMAERPGEYLQLHWHTKSGTGLDDTFLNGRPLRSWVDEQAIHTFGTVHSSPVGCCFSSWYAAPARHTTYYAQMWREALYGTKMDGSSLGSPRTIGLPGGTAIAADNLWADMYDSSTYWCILEPHRFELDADMTNATTFRAGGADQHKTNLNSNRNVLRAMYTDAVNPGTKGRFIQPAFPIQVYENGYSPGAGSWTDSGHPSSYTADGLELNGKLFMHCFLLSLGLTGYKLPVIDNCYWEPSGAYVEIWSSAGPITTTRLKRAIAALGTTFTHWTEVFGIQVNGFPATNATIVAGRIRITPTTGSFTNADSINFGEGGGTGGIEYPEDLINRIWLNSPIIDQGAYGIDGFPLVGVPSAAVLANTIAGQPFFTTAAGQSTQFVDPTAWPTGITGRKITIVIDGAFNNTGGTQYMFQLEGTTLGLELLNSRSLRLNLKTSGGTSVISNLSIGSISAFDNRTKVVVAIDWAAGHCYTTVGANATIDTTFTPSTSDFLTGSRKLHLLSSAAGGNYGLGKVWELAVYADCLVGGGIPSSGLRTGGQILGPAAVANTSSWKLGGAVT